MTPDELRELADAQPVATLTLLDDMGVQIDFRKSFTLLPGQTFFLYSHPAPAAPQAQPNREPLDDDEISKLAWQQNVWADGLIEFSFLAFARAVERAHGISGGGHD